MRRGVECLHCIHEHICDKTGYHVVHGCIYYDTPTPAGKWIKTGRTNIFGGIEIECSHCHTRLMVSPSRWEIGENYCDVCGAEMDKGAEE